MSAEPRVRLQRGPYAIVPNWISEAEISDGALRLWIVLYGYADRDTGTCYPHRATLAERLSVSSKRTVDRYLNELKTLGCVKIEHQFNGGGGQLGSIYHLNEEPGGWATDCTGGASQIAQGASNILRRGGDTDCPQEEQEPNEQEPSNNATPKWSDEVEALTQTLAKKVSENTRRPVNVTDAWRTSIDRIIRLDGYTADEVDQVIRWATADEFWRANILSAEKLRKRLPQLRLQMERGDGRRGRVLVTDEALAAAMAWGE
jgi:hypothetical protein